MCLIANFPDTGYPVRHYSARLRIVALSQSFDGPRCRFARLASHETIA